MELHTVHCIRIPQLLIKLGVSEVVLNTYIRVSFDSVLPNSVQGVIFIFATTNKLVDFIIFFRNNTELSRLYIAVQSSG